MKMIPGREHYTEMTPTEFEKYTLELLQNYAAGLEDAVFEHNVKEKTYDGIYQIDGRISCKVLGCEITILVECKRYKGPVKREQIQVLKDKIERVGAHKGIFVTTSFYQAGALEYASKHGIALLVIADGKLQYQIRGRQEMTDEMYPDDLPKFITYWQRQTGANTVCSSVIDGTKYLNELLS